MKIWLSILFVSAPWLVLGGWLGYVAFIVAFVFWTRKQIVWEEALDRDRRWAEDVTGVEISREQWIAGLQRRS